MQLLSNTNRSNSSSQASGEDRDLTNAFTGQDEFEKIIKQAESYPLLKLFKKYQINIDAFNRKSICPFSFHKGGRESTASFNFFPETNTFWCYGCKSGRTSVDFLSKIENINRFQAALKIIKNLDPSLSNISIEGSAVNLEERNKILFSFSKRMRDIILINPTCLNEVEEIFFIFDKMNEKYELESKGIQLLVERLNLKLDKFLCHQF